MISVENFRLELYDHLGVDEDDLSEAQADLLLNRSWWEIQGKFKFREAEKVKSAPIGVGASVRSYVQLASEDIGDGNDFPVSSIMNAFIVDETDNKQYPLTRVGQAEFTAMREADTTVEPRKTGIPEFYYLRNNAVYFWPTPDKPYILRCHFRATLADVENDGVSVPQEWHEIILVGAIWRGFMRFGDYNRANAAKAHQIALVNSTVPIEAKEERANSEYTGLQPIRRTKR